ncbi:Y-family DNA polymerase [Niabella drilacis]|uniref:Protein ImuB n=1 Tax=Niabella drilacis (strain DSM 25811 / CCM 8410 / CCUG 62505 / LMG 26954 / E90) TaxID=1285928 RepID=A0A1G6Y099_NIADE|nr:DNA polymerase Y family protein [Niabella drilacis]SDD83056.1 protein ImuB [Niabella drilacis]
MRRYLSIWFPALLADRALRLRPGLKDTPFIIAAPERGRLMVKAASTPAVKKGIVRGMVVADAKALLPALKLFHYKPGVEEKLLTRLAEWCLRFTPVVSPGLPDGILLDISGCPHLWGGEKLYQDAIVHQLKTIGYEVCTGIADTVGAAWAIARFGAAGFIAAPGQQEAALNPLPPAALRLEPPVLERLQKLGFAHIGSFIAMPSTVLRRRFGQALLTRIAQALGHLPETPTALQPAVIFREQLSCTEPVHTRIAIDIALETLLQQLCDSLQRSGKGLRSAVFKINTVDGGSQEIFIGTNRPVRNTAHLLKLFEPKMTTIAPGMGIEVFTLEAPAVEAFSGRQEAIWNTLGGADTGSELAGLLDRIAGRFGDAAIKRYQPAEHYWPERSVVAAGLSEKTGAAWRSDRPRPVYLLPEPEPVIVAAPVPDYPPMLFRYRGKVHNIARADGPERIEQEWWLEQRLVRDYYVVEDEDGARYWLFRAGHYGAEKPQWFLHGFFA